MAAAGGGRDSAKAGGRERDGRSGARGRPERVAVGAAREGAGCRRCAGERAVEDGERTGLLFFCLGGNGKQDS